MSWLPLARYLLAKNSAWCVHASVRGLPLPLSLSLFLSLPLPLSLPLSLSLFLSLSLPLPLPCLLSCQAVTGIEFVLSLLCCVAVVRIFQDDLQAAVARLQVLCVPVPHLFRCCC